MTRTPSGQYPDETAEYIVEDDADAHVDLTTAVDKRFYMCN